MTREQNAVKAGLIHASQHTEPLTPTPPEIESLNEGSIAYNSLAAAELIGDQIA